VPLPDVRGLAEGDAVDALALAGFRTVVAPAARSDAPAGTVVAQSPAPGLARQGSVVSIEVSG